MSEVILEKSKLIVGCAALAGLYSPVPTSEALRIVSAAVQKGLCHFDTAPWYGAGLSETLLGKALLQQNNSNSNSNSNATNLIVSTKVGRVIRKKDEVSPTNPNAIFNNEYWFKGDGTPRPANVVVHDYTYDGVMEAYRQSLQRLGPIAGEKLLHTLYLHDCETEERYATATSPPHRCA
eukprot:PhF_6_TR3368/c0_g1_i2/m.4799/K00064/E1.1.1.122; D-threo-aldose 1-dehydrogenase